MDAARASFQAGGPEAVSKFLIAADVYPLTDFDRARLHRLIAHVAFARTRSREAAAKLSAAATGLEPFDPALARETHLEAIWAGVRTGRFADVRPIVDAAARRPGHPDVDGERATNLLFDALVLAVRVGAQPARATIARATKEFCRAVAAGELANENVTAFSVAAHFALELWDQRSFSTLAHEVAVIARRRGAVVALPSALHYEALAFLLRGDLAGAKRSIEEADAIAGATQNQPDPGVSVLVAAWRGDQSTTSTLRTGILAQAAAHGAGLAVEVAEWAAAVLHNGAGEYAAAEAAACRALNAGRLGLGGWVLPELVEAAVRGGDRRLAEQAMEQLAQRAGLGDSSLARGIGARSRALLADDDAAEALYLRAIDELGQCGIPLYHARAMLIFGEWLRRAHRRVDARAQLRSALEEFEVIDAHGFAERTRRELIATGEKARKRTVETRDDLTPTETCIARLAIEGLSNPQIGKRLFLSHRTVEWHLRKVFVKLGIVSRRDLAQALHMAENAVAA